MSDIDYLMNLHPEPLDGVTEARWWDACACPLGPLDRDVVLDYNLVPRCPTCGYALGGLPSVNPPEDDESEVTP